jgi:hypothetical protein
MKAMQSSKEQPDWGKVHARRAMAGLGGMYLAGLWMAAPALLVLPVTSVFGEGDYLLVLMAIMYAGLFGYGLRIHRSSELHTSRRARGFWICVYSVMFFAVCGGLAIVFIPIRGWQ